VTQEGGRFITENRKLRLCENKRREVRIPEQQKGEKGVPSKTLMTGGGLSREGETTRKIESGKTPRLRRRREGGF